MSGNQKIILNFLVFFFAFHWSELARHLFQRIRRLFQPFGRSKNSDDVVRTELNFGKRKSVSEVFPHFLRNHTSSITLPSHLLIGIQMYMSYIFSSRFNTPATLMLKPNQENTNLSNIENNLENIFCTSQCLIDYAWWEIQRPSSHQMH